MGGDDEIIGQPEDCLDGGEDDEFLIPGDNTQNMPPQDAVPPINPDAPGNLTRIPPIGGEIPVVTPPLSIKP